MVESGVGGFASLELELLLGQRSGRCHGGQAGTGGQERVLVLGSGPGLSGHWALCVSTPGFDLGGGSTVGQCVLAP